MSKISLSYYFQKIVICVALSSCILVGFLGCGLTMINPGSLTENKRIASTPPGATYIIYDKAGKQLNTGITPRTIGWQKNYDTVKFEMSGFQTQTARMRKNKFNSMGLLADILLGGVAAAYTGGNDSAKIAGVGLGVAGGSILIDIITGNIVTYPDEIYVDMSHTTRSQTPWTASGSGGVAIEQAISTAIQQAIPRVTKNSIIAVLPITTTDNTLRDFVTSEAEYNLLNQEFSVVDRASLERIRTEQRLQTSGEIDSRTMSAMGRFSGANYILTGRIDNVSGQQTLWLRVLDVETSDIIGTAQIAFGESQPIANPIGIEDAVTAAIEQATSKLPRNSKLAIVNVDAEGSIKDFITGDSEFALVNKGYRVVDRAELDRIRREQGFQISGEVDDKTIVSIGKFAGADYLINIRADGRGGLTRLRWRILDTQTALLAGTASVPYQGISAKTSALSIEEALVQAINQATPRLTKDSRIAIVQVISTDTTTRDYVLGEAGHILVSQGFRVSNRSELDRIRREQGIQYSGEVDDRSAVSLGKLSGVKYIITGRIDGADSLHRLRLRILDTETAEVVGVAAVRF